MGQVPACLPEEAGWKPAPHRQYRWLGSNQRPSPYEGDALYQLSYTGVNRHRILSKTEPMEGIEPTPRFTRALLRPLCYTGSTASIPARNRTWTPQLRRLTCNRHTPRMFTRDQPSRRVGGSPIFHSVRSHIRRREGACYASFRRALHFREPYAGKDSPAARRFAAGACFRSTGPAPAHRRASCSSSTGCQLAGAPRAAAASPARPAPPSAGRAPAGAPSSAGCRSTVAAPKRRRPCRGSRGSV